MGYFTKIAAVMSALGVVSGGAAQAAFIGMPLNLKAQLDHITFQSPTLAPMAHTRFCMDYPQDCRTHKIMFRSGRVKLTPKRMQDLIAVNIEVNAAIRPEPNLAGLAGEKWLVSPASGDCNDYAVTKRHDMMARGWSADSLLLAEVVTSWGEHHLVVVVRTRNADLVMDNLNANIRPWSRTNYRWVRIQTPGNPLYWSTVGDRTV